MIETCNDTHCITCSDEGVAMRVLGLGSDGLASCVDDNGRWERIMTDLVSPVSPGDSVLVHAGVALVRLEPEARRA